MSEQPSAGLRPVPPPARSPAPVGAVAGAVAGGLAGKATAEWIDPTAEEAHWRGAYSTRPYYSEDVEFDTYAPAYRYGRDPVSKFADRRFVDIEPELKSDWDTSKDMRRLDWSKAKYAIRDAWQRTGGALS